ncbi:MAG TPA: phage holin family protein [Longimicrobiales bacterium]|nr:phage holin family protein [Longimicrobiales bacterium]
MRFIIRLLVTAAALWAAVALVPGILFRGPWWELLVVALVFGVLNAVIRPILLMLSCPLVVLTLGLFIFILNGFLLWLTGSVSQALGVDFRVEGVGAAIVGALVVSIVSLLLNIFVGDRSD